MYFKSSNASNSKTTFFSSSHQSIINSKVSKLPVSTTSSYIQITYQQQAIRISTLQFQIINTYGERNVNSIQ